MNDQQKERIYAERRAAILGFLEIHYNARPARYKDGFYNCQCPTDDHDKIDDNQAYYNAESGYLTCRGRHGVIEYKDMLVLAGIDTSKPLPTYTPRLREEKPKVDLPEWDKRWETALQRDDACIGLRAWLNKRGIFEAGMLNGRLGFSGDDKRLKPFWRNRLLIPHFNHEDKLVAVKWRSLPNEEKQYGSFTGSNYGGLYNLRDTPRQCYVIHEAELCAQSFNEWVNKPDMGLGCPLGQWTPEKAFSVAGCQLYVAYDRGGEQLLYDIQLTHPTAIGLPPHYPYKDWSDTISVGQVPDWAWQFQDTSYDYGAIIREVMYG